MPPPTPASPSTQHHSCYVDSYLERDLRGGLLGRCQRLDELVIVEDIALGVAQQEQNPVLNFLQLLLHLGVCHHYSVRNGPAPSDFTTYACGIHT